MSNLKRFFAAACALAAIALPARASSGLPPIRHVFTIVLENNEFATTFTAGQAIAPYLTRELPLQGAFVPNYYGTGHNSLDNYIAMVSGQSPNPKTDGDCEDPSTMGDNGQFRVDADGQAIGTGCTYPAQITSIATQLTDAGLTWKGYMQDMDASPGAHRTTCRGPFYKNNPTGAPGSPKTPDDYRAKHNPFVYFHSVFDDVSYCDARDVPLTGFEADLASVSTTPNYSMIVPNQCEDAHDIPTCSDSSTGGLSRADEFLSKYVPLIQASPAYQQDGMIVVLFDEGVSSAMCCDEPYPPNLGQPNSTAPVTGWGGGQTGAILISKFIKPMTVTPTAYNHYSYLRSMEDLFGLSHLGYAARAGLVPFGPDVYTNA
jgi:hypothetical protein